MCLLYVTTPLEVSISLLDPHDTIQCILYLDMVIPSSTDKDTGMVRMELKGKYPLIVGFLILVGAAVTVSFIGSHHLINKCQ